MVTALLMFDLGLQSGLALPKKEAELEFMVSTKAVILFNRQAVTRTERQRETERGT